jgi:hypothetical protein
MRAPTLASTALAMALTACGPTAAPPLPAGDSGLARMPALLSSAIETDAEGRCWGRDVEPAVIETVTLQEMATPEIRGEDGSLVAPATYRTTVVSRIARERSEVAFETLCPPAYTAAFVASLQRALAVRGHYDGLPDGILDTDLGRAVQDFQRIEGPDSPLLSLAAARRLGLVALSPEELSSL